ncbi:hypothetical protein DFH06DRAFT_1309027 [Mycena polygramma]|nr:hypothetical protein DFH06DRAFT_1309027 [Mycena polygramma]
MYDEDFSDLTDLDELDDEYDARPAAKKKGKGKGKAKSGDTYRIRNALKAPRATTYSTEALYKQIHNGDIDLEPEYQRDVVWPEAKQIGLIDSIFRNFYVPPVIFAVNALDDGTETRTCIDGKQRLTSIHRFVDGLIPHKDPVTGDKLWYRDNPDHRTRQPKRILSEKYRNLFDAKAVVCVEYQDLKDTDEREIFQRVQLGVALTPAEKLKVLATPRAQFVRTLQDDFLNNDDSGLSGAALAWDRSRGSDFRCLSQTIQCIAHSPKTTSIQATEKWLADPAPMTPAFANSIENTYRVFEALVRDARNGAAFAKISPIEFITVGILVHRHKGRLTLETLGKAVAAMRADVRRVHDDIRNNSKVYKTMAAFIDGYEGPALGRGEVCAADAVGNGFGPVVINPTSTSVSTAKAGTKRKATAAQDSGDEDSDDDYAPAKRAAPRKRASPAKKPASKPASTAQSPLTPPMSASPSNASAPPPEGGNARDVIRKAKEQIEARRLAGLAAPVPAPTMPSPSIPPYAFNPNANGQQQQQAYTALYQQQQQQQQSQQQQQNGAAGVAAALEANLMGAYPPASARVKTEPAGPPPFSAGSTGSGGGYESGGGGGGRYGGGGGSGHRGGYDRDRDRDRGRDYDYDYGGRGDKRSGYRERDHGHGRGRGGW